MCSKQVAKLSQSPDHRIFEKVSVKQWRRVVHKELRGTGLPSEDPVYRACFVLAGIFCFGTDVEVLVEVSGQTADFVRAVLKRARRTRILSGRRLMVAWLQAGIGGLAVILDAMTVIGDLYRGSDPKRSAAAKARKNPAARSARPPRQKVEPGTIFSPTVVRSNPLYGLAKWEPKRGPDAGAK